MKSLFQMTTCNFTAVNKEMKNNKLQFFSVPVDYRQYSMTVWLRWAVSGIWCFFSFIAREESLEFSCDSWAIPRWKWFKFPSAMNREIRLIAYSRFIRNNTEIAHLFFSVTASSSDLSCVSMIRLQLWFKNSTNFHKMMIYYTFTE